MTPRPHGPQEKDDLLQMLGRILVGAAPRSWSHLVYTARIVGAFSEHTLDVQGPDGRVHRFPVPGGVETAAAGLKRVCYRPGRGTWMSMDFTVQRTGRYDVDYDHSVEPEHAALPAPADYARELERFPRADQCVPAWLRTRLGRAGTAGPSAVNGAPGDPGGPGDGPAPLTPDEAVRMLVFAFAVRGADVSFQGPDTLLVPRPGGSGVPTDVSRFRAALTGASPEQGARHAAEFVHAVWR
ncbi:hypothetical protein [Nocardiopsis sp. CNT312]|uniref:hypothetical protein n=1 Tax=Nocardiopsis sp. CNT312 TaxID=1137268 RepID=UPI0004BBF394|nr:hypothetical protein [Nocardiopsis sp. CNT312]